MTGKNQKGKKSGVSESGLIDITQRKFRWSDYLAEKIIRGVAFLSITIIVLIFIFVFRESCPIFSSAKPAQHTETANTADEVQETYGEVDDQPVGEEVQETYGEVTDSTNTQETSQSYTVSDGSGYDDNQSALKSLASKAWYPVSEKPRFGLYSLILGTFKITIISMLFAAPIAILAAIYTASFAGKRLKEIIKPTIEMLAGFPSVVIGFFALMVLASFLQDVFNYDTRLNSFVGGIGINSPSTSARAVCSYLVQSANRLTYSQTLIELV